MYYESFFSLGLGIPTGTFPIRTKALPPRRIVDVSAAKVYGILYNPGDGPSLSRLHLFLVILGSHRRSAQAAETLHSIASTRWMSIGQQHLPTTCLRPSCVYQSPGSLPHDQIHFVGVKSRM